jgi:hypothetical protein
MRRKFTRSKTLLNLWSASSARPGLGRWEERLVKLESKITQLARLQIWCAHTGILQTIDDGVVALFCESN